VQASEAEVGDLQAQLAEQRATIDRARASVAASLAALDLANSTLCRHSATTLTS
jgi:multidrug resistance efflux pump